MRSIGASFVLIAVLALGYGLLGGWQTRPPDPVASPVVAHAPPRPGETGRVKLGEALSYTIVREGQGIPLPEKGTARVHYIGWLTDGTEFDSTRDRGQPIDFPIGQGHVIPGWDRGVPGMRTGEIRRLYIPSRLAYGEDGTPGGPIPPNADLVFEVELVKQDSSGLERPR